MRANVEAVVQPDQSAVGAGDGGDDQLGVEGGNGVVLVGVNDEQRLANVGRDAASISQQSEELNRRQRVEGAVANMMFPLSLVFDVGPTPALPAAEQAGDRHQTLSPVDQDQWGGHGDDAEHLRIAVAACRDVERQGAAHREPAEEHAFAARLQRIERRVHIGDPLLLGGQSELIGRRAMGGQEQAMRGDTLLCEMPTERADLLGAAGETVDKQTGKIAGCFKMKWLGARQK